LNKCSDAITGRAEEVSHAGV